LIIRYLILSPSDEVRGRLFNSLFEDQVQYSPKGGGEKVNIEIEGDYLEFVGAGVPSRLLTLAKKLVENAVQLDGILLLIPSGDDASWQEAKTISNWVDEEMLGMPVRIWVYGDPEEITREKARKELLTLFDVHLQELRV